MISIDTIVVISLFFSCLVRGDPDTALVKRVCTARHYNDYRGWYGIRLYYILKEVSGMTAKRGYSYSVYGRSHGELTSKCYGHAACNGKVSPLDCASCLNTAASDMINYCTSSVGARMKLEDCRITYEDYPFDPNY